MIEQRRMDWLLSLNRELGRHLLVLLTGLGLGAVASSQAASDDGLQTAPFRGDPERLFVVSSRLSQSPLVLLPNGEWLSIGAGARIFPVGLDGQPRALVGGHIVAARLTPSGRHVILDQVRPSRDSRLFVVSLADERIVTQIQKGAGFKSHWSLDGDDAILLHESTGGTTRVCWTTGERRHFDLHEVTVSPEGDRALVARAVTSRWGTTVSLIKWPSLEELHTSRGKRFLFSPQGRFACIATNSEHILLEARTGAVLWRDSGSPGRPTLFSEGDEDKKCWLIRHGRRQLEWIEATNPTKVQQVAFDRRVLRVSPAQGTSRVLVQLGSWSNENEHAMVDLGTERIVWRREALRPPGQLRSETAIGANGRSGELYMNVRGETRRLDLATGRPIGQVPSAGRVEWLSDLSTDGDRIIATSRIGRCVLIEPEFPPQSKEIGQGEEVLEARFEAGGRRIVLLGTETTRVLDSKSLQLLGRWPRSAARSAHFAHQGASVLLLGDAGWIRFDLDRRTELDRGAGRFDAAALSDDGSGSVLIRSNGWASIRLKSQPWQSFRVEASQQRGLPEAEWRKEHVAILVDRRVWLISTDEPTEPTLLRCGANRPMFGLEEMARIEFSPQGESLLARSTNMGSEQLVCWDVPRRSIRWFRDYGTCVGGTRSGWSPDGTRAFFDSTRPEVIDHDGLPSLELFALHGKPSEQDDGFPVPRFSGWSQRRTDMALLDHGRVALSVQGGLTLLDSTGGILTRCWLFGDGSLWALDTTKGISSSTGHATEKVRAVRPDGRLVRLSEMSSEPDEDD